MMLSLLFLCLVLEHVYCICIQENRFTLSCYYEDYFEQVYPLVTTLILFDCTITVAELMKCFQQVKTIILSGTTAQRMCVRLKNLHLKLVGCPATSTTIGYELVTVLNEPENRQATTNNIGQVTREGTQFSKNELYAIVFSSIGVILILAIMCCVFKKKRVLFCLRYNNAEVNIALDAMNKAMEEKGEEPRTQDNVDADELLNDDEEETVFDKSFVEPKRESSAQGVVEALRRTTRISKPPDRLHYE